MKEKLQTTLKKIITEAEIEEYDDGRQI